MQIFDVSAGSQVEVKGYAVSPLSPSQPLHNLLPQPSMTAIRDFLTVSLYLWQ